jgi:hypothetical protein
MLRAHGSSGTGQPARAACSIGAAKRAGGGCEGASHPGRGMEAAVSPARNGSVPGASSGIAATHHPYREPGNLTGETARCPRPTW